MYHNVTTDNLQTIFSGMRAYDFSNTELELLAHPDDTALQGVTLSNSLNPAVTLTGTVSLPESVLSDSVLGLLATVVVGTNGPAVVSE